MTRAYNVVDADGHILEPLNLWDDYIEPSFRDRAPRIARGSHNARHAARQSVTGSVLLLRETVAAGGIGKACVRGKVVLETRDAPRVVQNG